MTNPDLDRFYWLDLSDVDRAIDHAHEEMEDGLDDIRDNWGNVASDDVQDLIKRVEEMVRETKRYLEDARLGDAPDIVAAAQEYVEENRNMEGIVEDVLYEATGREIVDPVEKVYAWIKSALRNPGNMTRITVL